MNREKGGVERGRWVLLVRRLAPAAAASCINGATRNRRRYGRRKEGTEKGLTDVDGRAR